MKGKEGDQLKEEAEKVFIYKYGLLYKKQTNKLRPKAKPLEVMVVPCSAKCVILFDFHDAAGHVGSTKLRETIYEHFWWKGMARDIIDYIRSCEECQLKKFATGKKAKLLSVGQNLRKEFPEAKPFHLVATDLGNFKKKSRGHQYFIIVVDLITRFVELDALKEASAKEITFLKTK